MSSEAGGGVGVGIESFCGSLVISAAASAGDFDLGRTAVVTASAAATTVAAIAAAFASALEPILSAFHVTRRPFRLYRHVAPQTAQDRVEGANCNGHLVLL